MADDNNDEGYHGPQQRGYRSGGGLVPIPDPTKLTLEVVALAKKEIEKLFDTKIRSVENDIERLEHFIAEIPILSDQKRQQLRELFEQKFIGVATEFTMRDIALAAAFKAAEAAVKQQQDSNAIASDKMSSSFTKQIDSLDEKIDDLKSRISELTGRNWAAVGAYIVGAIGIAALVISMLRHVQ